MIPNRAVFASCLSPTELYRRTEVEYYACGQCPLCVVRRSREWRDRLMHELDYWSVGGLFITLTYEDSHLPDNGSLSMDDLQRFWKRLRKALGRRKIKYFAVGEYGESPDPKFVRRYRYGLDNVGRPHYHAIVFGLSSSDLELLTSAWTLGFLHIGEVNTVTVNYVLGYTQKKLRKQEKYIYDSFDIKPPFQVQSKGLGRRWLEDNILLVKDTLSYTVNGVSRGLPRYYVKLLKALFGDDVIKSMLLDRARDYTAQLEDEYRACKDPNYTRPDLDYLARGICDDFIDWLKATAQVKYNRLVFNLNKLKRRDVYG